MAGRRIVVLDVRRLGGAGQRSTLRGLGGRSRGSPRGSRGRGRRSTQPHPHPQPVSQQPVCSQQQTFLQQHLLQNSEFISSHNGRRQQHFLQHGSQQAFSQQAGLAQQPQAFSQQAGLRSSRKPFRSKRAWRSSRKPFRSRRAWRSSRKPFRSRRAWRSSRKPFRSRRACAAAASLFAAGGLGAAAASLFAAGGLGAAAATLAGTEMPQAAQQRPLAAAALAAGLLAAGGLSAAAASLFAASGLGAAAASLFAAGRFRAQQAFAGPQVSQRQHCLHSNRSFNPQNKSRTGVTRQQLLSQQAFSHPHASQPQPPPRSSHPNPLLQRATLSRSAPTIHLLLIEQQLLYNELRCLGIPLGATTNRSAHLVASPMAWAGSPLGKNRLKRGLGSRVRDSGLAPAVRTVYCARAVEPILGPIISTRSGCLTRPRSVPPRHAPLLKGQ